MTSAWLLPSTFGMSRGRSELQLKRILYDIVSILLRYAIGAINDCLHSRLTHIEG
jgi:hypothetical protein